ncbi:rRNA-processing protein EFG1, partial [Durusdinium trenchii]
YDAKVQAQLEQHKEKRESKLAADAERGRDAQPRARFRGTKRQRQDSRSADAVGRKPVDVKKAKHMTKEQERAITQRNHKIKFFERTKVERKLKKTARLLRKNPEDETLAKEQARLLDDLRYCMFFPRGKQCLSLFPSEPLSDQDAEHQARCRAQAIAVSKLTARGSDQALLEFTIPVPERMRRAAAAAKLAKEQQQSAEASSGKDQVAISSADASAEELRQGQGGGAQTAGTGDTAATATSEGGNGLALLGGWSFEGRIPSHRAQGPAGKSREPEEGGSITMLREPTGSSRRSQRLWAVIAVCVVLNVGLATTKMGSQALRPLWGANERLTHDSGEPDWRAPRVDDEDTALVHFFSGPRNERKGDDAAAEDEAIIWLRPVHHYDVHEPRELPVEDDDIPMWETDSHVVFHHIPKTGGQTFLRVLREMGKHVPNHEDCYYPMHNEKKVNTVILRSPREHVFSQYLHGKYNEGSRKKHPDYPFDTFDSDGDRRGLDKWLRHFGPQWRIGDGFFHSFNPREFQTRTLTCRNPVEEQMRGNHNIVEERDYSPSLEEAKTNLLKMHW